VYGVAADLVSTPFSIFFCKEWMLTEMFGKQVKDLLSVSCRAENIVGVLGRYFIILEHPIQAIILVTLTIFTTCFVKIAVHLFK